MRVFRPRQHGAAHPGIYECLFQITLIICFEKALLRKKKYLSYNLTCVKTPQIIMFQFQYEKSEPILGRMQTEFPFSVQNKHRHRIWYKFFTDFLFFFCTECYWTRFLSVQKQDLDKKWTRIIGLNQIRLRKCKTEINILLGIIFVFICLF